jgi:hypothetical protein
MQNWVFREGAKHTIEGHRPGQGREKTWEGRGEVGRVSGQVTRDSSLEKW